MKQLAIAAFALAVGASCDADFRFDGPASEALTDAAASDARPDPFTGPCAADVDCALPSLHCDTSSGACVPCIFDMQCTAQGRPRCDLALHSCVECGSNQDCGFNAVCEPLTRKCIARCAEGTACPASASRCTELGRCVECVNGSDCPPSRRYCEKSSGRCAECRESADCQGILSRCDQAQSKCVQCVLSPDCPPATPVCDPATSACVKR